MQIAVAIALFTLAASPVLAQPVRLELRIVPQSGTLPGPITDLPAPEEITPATVWPRRFEVQARVVDLDLTDTTVPSGLVEATIRIGVRPGPGSALGGATLARAMLSRFEVQLSSDEPPDVVDSSGSPTGSMAGATGVHRPFRTLFPAPLPNNDAAANGTFLTTGAPAIGSIQLRSLGADLHSTPNGWYGLYSFEFQPTSLTRGEFVLTAELNPPVPTSAYQYFADGGSITLPGSAHTPAMIAIRATPGPVACCALDRTCSLAPSATDCRDAGGTVAFSAACTPEPCTMPAMGCCLPSFSCILTLSDLDCRAQSGSPRVEGCGPGNCDSPTVTCCASDQTCSRITSSACAAIGGIVSSATSCTPQACVSASPCCLPTGACQLVLNSAHCQTLGGRTESVCNSSICFSNLFTCCRADGTCVLVAATQVCAAADGQIVGRVACSPTLCAAPAPACCFDNGSCVVAQSIDDCRARGGIATSATLCEPGSCSAGSGRVLTVRLAGPGGPGPWATASADLAATVGAAVSGDEVWVEQGEYDAALMIPDGVRVRGGFAGHELTLGDRDPDPAAYVTRLYRANAQFWRPLSVSNAGPTTLIDRLTISGGRPGTGLSANNGGGVIVSLGSPRFFDCVFEDNVAGLGTSQNFFGGSGGYGGGVYAQLANPAFIRCTFRRNAAGEGGRGACAGSITIPGAGGSGGAVALDGSSAVFNRCEFVDNASGRGGYGLGGGSACSGPGAGAAGGSGGAIFANRSRVAIVACEFSRNFAGRGGDGAQLRGVDSNGGPGGRGGALALQESTAVVVNSLFVSNSGGDGGDTASTVASDYAARAGDGGSGGHISTSAPGTSAVTVVNSTLVLGRPGNAGQIGSGYSLGEQGTIGGLFMVPGGTTTIRNCIFWNNTAGQVADVGATLSISHATVQGGALGQAILTADPRFVAPDLGFFSLAPASGCIDAADNTALPGWVVTDRSNNPRFVDVPGTPDTGVAGGGGGARIADNGCFERQLDSVCIGDFNRSGAVSVQDIFDFLAAYFSNSPNADVNNSGEVTVQDIFEFLAAYFTGC